jgi:hypothetical protein
MDGCIIPERSKVASINTFWTELNVVLLAAIAAVMKPRKSATCQDCNLNGETCQDQKTSLDRWDQYVAEEIWLWGNLEKRNIIPTDNGSSQSKHISPTS